ncbi:hypothetical protein ACO2Q9_10840 [Variovorax sp. VNK109]|uniref:hypothetical protein n=1 Tax=Comamonadaceae TaxID=80864 RepID=UPI0012901F84|nr:hypothetical protein [Acidovorax sp. ST3]
MTTTPQFDSYFFGDDLLTDARRGVAEAVAQTRAAGLKVEGYASHLERPDAEIGSLGTQPKTHNKPVLDGSEQV